MEYQDYMGIATVIGAVGTFITQIVTLMRQRKIKDQISAVSDKTDATHDLVNGMSAQKTIADKAVAFNEGVESTKQ